MSAYDVTVSFRASEDQVTGLCVCDDGYQGDDCSESELLCR